MGVKSLCIPVDLGQVLLNADWDAAAGTAQKGRYISLGFENLNQNGGWGTGFLVYSTYDVLVGTEYDKFASLEDYQALQAGKMGSERTSPGIFDAVGSRGFLRVHMGMAYGATPLYQVYVVPSEKSYVALVVNLGSYQDDLQMNQLKFTAGDFPANLKPFVDQFSKMAKTIELK